MSTAVPRLLVVVLAVVLAVAAAPREPADAEAKTRSRTACERLQGKDLAPAKKLKVVRRARDDGSVRVLACTLRGGRVRTVASYEPQTEFESGELVVDDTADRHVLLSESTSERGTTRRTFRVDTRTRKRVTVASEVCDRLGACDGEVAERTVMHRSGVLAAVIRDKTPGCCGQTTVGPARLVRIARSGKRTTLADGEGISELEVRDRTFRWTQDGVARTAPLS